MKISKLLSKLLIVLLIGVTFVSCEKDNPEAPPVIDPGDLVISINENSSFNQRNFKISFDQLFFSMIWDFEFSHHSDANLKLVNSKANSTVFGKLGDGFISFEHIYHELGYITHSNQSYTDQQNGRDLVLEYEYDQMGFITKMNQKYGDEIYYVIEIDYNDQKQLISKRFYKEGELVRTESYKYYIDGQISEMQNLSNFYKFIYNDGLLSEIKRIGDSGDEESYFMEYDNTNRIKLFKINDNLETKVHYEDTQLLMEGYTDNMLNSIGTFEQGMFQRKYTEIKYDDGIFDYAVEKEFDDNGKPVKKYYYYGEIAQFELFGYSTIEVINQSQIQNRRESYFTKDDELVNYCQFHLEERMDAGGYGHTLTNFQWFLPDGTDITGSFMIEDWIRNMEVY